MKTEPCTLIKICEGVWIVKENDSMDLMFSQDDEDRTGKGFYWHQINQSSILYKSLYEVVKAYKTHKIKWE
jgi:hypothetical protein